MCNSKEGQTMVPHSWPAFESRSAQNIAHSITPFVCQKRKTPYLRNHYCCHADIPHLSVTLQWSQCLGNLLPPVALTASPGEEVSKVLLCINNFVLCAACYAVRLIIHTNLHCDSCMNQIGPIDLIRYNHQHCAYFSVSYLIGLHLMR